MAMRNAPQRLQFICRFLIAGQVMFLGAVVYMIIHQEIPPNHESQILEIMTPIVAIGCILIAFILPTRILKRHSTGNLTIRFKQYQTATILRYALLELATFMGIITYLLSAQWYTLIVPVILIGIQIYLFPTVKTMKEELNATQQELETV